MTTKLNIRSGKKKFLSTNGAGKPVELHIENKVKTILHTYCTKLNSKLTKDLKII